MRLDNLALPKIPNNRFYYGDVPWDPNATDWSGTALTITRAHKPTDTYLGRRFLGGSRNQLFRRRPRDAPVRVAVLLGSGGGNRGFGLVWRLVWAWVRGEVVRVGSAAGAANRRLAGVTPAFNSPSLTHPSRMASRKDD